MDSFNSYTDATKSFLTVVYWIFWASNLGNSAKFELLTALISTWDERHFHYSYKLEKLLIYTFTFLDSVNF